jgi:hypothetical protein
MPESSLGDGLTFEAMLPFEWSSRPLPDAAELASLNSEDHQLLSADSTLDEVRVHEALKDESPALVHELQRLDFKLNILLRLTAVLAMRQSGIPQPRAARFTATVFEWAGDDAPAIGSTGLLMLYVNPSLPHPLKIPCVVRAASHNPSTSTQLQFTGLSETVVELIEKMIFRHHRRSVAGARLAPQRTS